MNNTYTFGLSSDSLKYIQKLRLEISKKNTFFFKKKNKKNKKKILFFTKKKTFSFFQKKTLNNILGIIFISS